MSGVVGIVLCVVCIPLLVLNFVMIIKGFVRPNEVPSVFNFCPIIEGNDLMASSSTRIKEGDLLFFRKGNADYTLGEDGTIVAIMTNNGTVIVRRLIGSRTGADGKELYVADAENHEDYTRVEVSTDDIVGVYAGRMAGMGKLIMFSHRPLGTFLLVVLPLLLLFIAEYFIIRQDRAKATVENPTAPVAVICNPYASDIEDEKIIAEYEAYIDEDGNQVVKRVKKAAK